MYEILYERKRLTQDLLQESKFWFHTYRALIITLRGNQSFLTTVHVLLTAVHS